MKKVITYGTFDLFHEGHHKLLERARKLGDYLIVGVTTENYDDSRGKLNVQQGLMKRIENVRSSGLCDEIIIEEYEGQKIIDIMKYNVDIFAIGSDWTGKFDYLSDYCKVVYLERTKGVSSTQLRAESSGVLSVGIVGTGRIADRFVRESKFVSGVHVEGAYGRNLNTLSAFVDKHELSFCSSNYDEFLDQVSAVYIASPHLTHYDYAKRALQKGRHVLCEKPMVLSSRQAEDLYGLAEQSGCVLLEALKTAYSPGFIRLVSLAKSGLIGEIKSVDATFTKLIGPKKTSVHQPTASQSETEVAAASAPSCTRELDPDTAGGSVTELSSYPLLAIVKLLGVNYLEISFDSYYDRPVGGVDMFTRISIFYRDAVATAKVGLGVKSEGELTISGTRGYIYVPAPWWKTEFFEIRFEEPGENKKYYFKFEGDGLRYELAEFVSLITRKNLHTYKLGPSESIAISRVIEAFMVGKNVRIIQ